MEVFLTIPASIYQRNGPDQMLYFVEVVENIPLFGRIETMTRSSPKRYQTCLYEQSALPMRYRFNRSNKQGFSRWSTPQIHMSTYFSEAALAYTLPFLSYLYQIPYVPSSSKQPLNCISVRPMQQSILLDLLNQFLLHRMSCLKHLLRLQYCCRLYLIQHVCENCVQWFWLFRERCNPPSETSNMMNPEKPKSLKIEIYWNSWDNLIVFGGKGALGEGFAGVGDLACNPRPSK